MELKHGYTLLDLQQMMHAAVIADRTLALDYQTRSDIAWSAIATALYEADEPPHRQALIRVGWQAIYSEVRTMYRGRGYVDARAGEAEMKPRFAMFWGKQVEHSHEDRVVERVAVHQVLAQLRDTYRDAIAALAVHENYQAAAAAMGLKQSAFNVRIATARKSLVALWLEHETPHKVRRTDRRVEVAGQELATHCGNGHEWTAENTRWSRVARSGGKRRDCRACESERSQRRTAERKASRSDAA
jgi:DNA-directed RNA polymerase specialized sigma24 family protein